MQPHPRILIAPYPFKGTLTSRAAAEAMAEGIGRIAIDDLHYELLPLGDGGSGTLDALMIALGGEYRTTTCRDMRDYGKGVHGYGKGVRVYGKGMHGYGKGVRVYGKGVRVYGKGLQLKAPPPTGESPPPTYQSKIQNPKSKICKWSITPDNTAIIEAAQAIALADVPIFDRDPSMLSSFPLGELIVAALDADVSALTIGLGDTATHDCGLGVAAALGYRFLGRDGEELEPVGRSLRRIAHIDRSGARTIPDTISVLVYCDVLNPLCGPDGAALRFAGQKGAGIDSIEELEEGSGEFAEVIRRDLGIDVATIPGAGAAGGLGAGLAAFCGGRLTGGAEGVLDAVGFDERARNADLVITGEGRLDEKTLLGKGVAHVVRRAHRLGTRVLIITGGVEGEVGWWEKELGARIVEL